MYGVTVKRRVIVHLVHGTWGRGFVSVVRQDIEASGQWRFLCRILNSAKKKTLWFEAKSEFRKSVLNKVDPELRDAIEFREFLWSGSNSMNAREFAAEGLRTHLRAAFSEAPDACHLLIAHSHGGVVAFDAVTREGGTASRQLDGLLSLGTPYLSLEEDASVEKGAEDVLKVLMFALLPTAVATFFLALLVTLVAAGFHAAAVWLGSMIVGLFLGLEVMPRIAHRAVLRHLADLFFVFICAGAIWGAFSAASSWITLSDLAGSILDNWERGTRYPFGVIVSCCCALVLLASRVSALREPGTVAFMLRDTVTSFLSAMVPFVMFFATLWAFFSHSAWLRNFAFIFLFFWPILTLGVYGALQTKSAERSDKKPSERSLAPWRRLAKEQPIPELPCPFVALRLPGDEASLAILASLLARAISSLISTTLQSFARLKKIPRWLLGLIIMLGLGGIASGAYEASIPRGWPSYTIGPLLGIGLVCGGLVSATLFVLTCLFGFSLLTIGLLALAVGSEVNELVPIVRVNCEPLPRCVPPDRCRLEIQWLTPELQAQRSLRHFLHELEPVQQRVAEWITERAGLAASTAASP
jgi:hypothetical protein